MLDERTKTWRTAAPDDLIEDLRSAAQHLLFTLPTPEVVPCPEGLYERIIKRLDRADKADRRRARQQRKKRRGWA